MLTVVAIDGPAGAGKSTISSRLAARLGAEHLDTGAMYRAVAAGALRRGVDVRDEVAVAAMLEDLGLEIDAQRVVVDGHEVTEEIRSSEVTAAVSAVAAIAAVRSDLVGRQRAWARSRRLAVLEGRDIGTVVAPDAILKVFLTASPRVRAQRRVAQAGGDLDAVEAAIRVRDEADSTRADSPLRAAEDAVVVDTSDVGIDEVVERLCALYHARVAEVGGR